MRVLVIEADAHVGMVLERRLRRDMFKVDCTDLGEEGAELVRHYQYDLVTLGLNLSDIPGETVLRRLKLTSARIPVLILSRDESIERRLRCFALGADDYVTKPCHGDEIVARANAIIRRVNGYAAPILQIGELSVDTEAREVWAYGRPVRLTRREYELFEVLALRLNKAVTKDTLLTQMYENADEPESRIIEVYVSKIRRKIDAVAPSPQARIETIRGIGYMLQASPQSNARPPIAQDGGISGLEPSATSRNSASP